MQCSWVKFRGTEHFVGDREMFEIEGSRDKKPSKLRMYLKGKTLSQHVEIYTKRIKIRIKIKVLKFIFKYLYYLWY